ncbi:hypothetical protein [Weeksella virosa]
MFFDGVIVGVNFDQHMFGKEVTSLELAEDLIQKLCAITSVRYNF